MSEYGQVAQRARGRPLDVDRVEVPPCRVEQRRDAARRVDLEGDLVGDAQVAQHPRELRLHRLRVGVLGRHANERRHAARRLHRPLELRVPVAVRFLHLQARRLDAAQRAQRRRRLRLLARLGLGVGVPARLLGLRLLPQLLRLLQPLARLLRHPGRLRLALEPRHLPQPRLLLGSPRRREQRPVAAHVHVHVQALLDLATRHLMSTAIVSIAVVSASSCSYCLLLLLTTTKCRRLLLLEELELLHEHRPHHGGVRVLQRVG